MSVIEPCPNILDWFAQQKLMGLHFDKTKTKLVISIKSFPDYAIVPLTKAQIQQLIQELTEIKDKMI